MFAAGNNARRALEALLDRGASVSIRDRRARLSRPTAAVPELCMLQPPRLPGPGAVPLLLTRLPCPAARAGTRRRGRNVLDYAAADSEVRGVLEARIAEMESKAARLQVGRGHTRLASRVSARQPGRPGAACMHAASSAMRAGSALRAPICLSSSLLSGPCACLQEELLAELLDDEMVQQGTKCSSRKSKKKKGRQGKAKAAPAAGESLAAEAQQAAAEAQATVVADLPPTVVEQLDDAAEQQGQEEQQQPQSCGRRPPAEQAGPCRAASSPVEAFAATASNDEQHGRQPGSFEWQVVGRRKREEQQHQQQLCQRHLDASGGATLRRCPSASSMGSSCRYAPAAWALDSALLSQSGLCPPVRRPPGLADMAGNAWRDRAPVPCAPSPLRAAARATTPRAAASGRCSSRPPAPAALRGATQRPSPLGCSMRGQCPLSHRQAMPSPRGASLRQLRLHTAAMSSHVRRRSSRRPWRHVARKMMQPSLLCHQWCRSTSRRKRFSPAARWCRLSAAAWQAAAAAARAELTTPWNLAGSRRQRASRHPQPCCQPSCPAPCPRRPRRCHSCYPSRCCRCLWRRQRGMWRCWGLRWPRCVLRWLACGWRSSGRRRRTRASWRRCWRTRPPTRPRQWRRQWPQSARTASTALPRSCRWVGPCQAALGRHCG